MAEISDGSTVAPNPSVEALIKAELARFARRQLFVQVAVQLVVQVAAYGSMAFFLYRIHRTVQQVAAGLQNTPQEMLNSLRRASASKGVPPTGRGRDSPPCEDGGARRVDALSPFRQNLRRRCWHRRAGGSAFFACGLWHRRVSRRSLSTTSLLGSLTRASRSLIKLAVRSRPRRPLRER